MTCNAISAQGTTLEIGSTGSPTTYTDIGSLKSYSGFDGQRSEIDKSCLSSTSKEFLLGLKDEGGLQIEVNVDHSDAGQSAVRTALTETSARSYRLTSPNGKVSTFEALVKSFDEKGGVDEVVTGTISLRITGPRTIT